MAAAAEIQLDTLTTASGWRRAPPASGQAHLMCMVWTDGVVYAMTVTLQ